MAGVAAALLATTLAPTSVSADRGSHESQSKSESKQSPTALLNGYQRRLIGMTESDPWLFDDGCIGGSSKKDPLYMLVPLTDPPSTESACTVDEDARIIIAAAGFTCWQPTFDAARDECEAGWADPAQVLLHASVTIDGKAKRLTEYRVSGRFTFPDGAILDVPGTETVYYGITSALIVRELDEGTHEISVSFEYADGFEGATTFALTVTDD
ncbi:MAG: hypothetical protein ABI894_13550 [Ilumatobacteraceae bacterium]